MNIQEYQNVFVLAEQRDGVLQSVALELLGKGREIADTTKSKLVAVLVGHQIEGLVNDLIAHGADHVIYVDDPCLAHYTTEPYAQAIYPILADKKPNIVLIGATSIGRDLAPRLAAKLHTGLTADCTRLSVDEAGALLMTRPAFGGNLMAGILCPNHRPQMSTVRPGVMRKLARDDARKGSKEIYKIKFNTSRFLVEVVEEIKETKAKVRIEDAKILVSGGRGVGKENMPMLEALAKELKGTVSASRAVVDAGLIDHDRQVGQTGKTVRPDVYFALGISGAIQHIAGMEESEFIIAVNKDKYAPIFAIADLGIVGDVRKIVPLLTEEIRQLRKK